MNAEQMREIAAQRAENFEFYMTGEDWASKTKFELVQHVRAVIADVIRAIPIPPATDENLTPKSKPDAPTPD